ncbi:MAG: TRAP transporter small permease [Rhodobacteraceae bacterium]|nr:TRAP transporter small permease [Paracoccaceae bacterium]
MLLRALDALPRWLHALGAFVILPLLTLLVSVDVVMRYVFSAPLSWSLEISKYMLLIMTLLGLLQSFRDDVHIRVDIFHNKLPRPVLRLVALAVHLCIGFIFALIALKATEEARFAFRVGLRSPQLEWPTWPPLALVSLTSWGLVLYAGLAAIGDLSGRRTPTTDRDTLIEESE